MKNDIDLELSKAVAAEGTRKVLEAQAELAACTTSENLFLKDALKDSAVERREMRANMAKERKLWALGIMVLTVVSIVLGITIHMF